MRILDLERRDIDSDEGRMQWRGSIDGITWTEWSVLTCLDMPLPSGPYFAAQARIWIDGMWDESPVCTYEEA